MSLTSALACHDFLRTQPPRAIADRLRHDQRLCRDGRLPSILTFYLPQPSTREADEIAVFLTPSGGSVNSTRDLRRLVYTGISQGIKTYLAQMDHHLQGLNMTGQTDDSASGYLEADPVASPCTKKDSPDKPYLDSKSDGLGGIVDSKPASVGGNAPKISPAKSPKEHARSLTESEIRSTVKVLACLQADRTISDDTTLSDNISYVQKLFPRSSRVASQPSRHLLRKCYICRFVLLGSHPLYSELCIPCGDFNLSEAGLSLPEKLSLRSKSAVVTGGRVNLGFHTALRLLRCGANVIVSSRYPRC